MPLGTVSLQGFSPLWIPIRDIPTQVKAGKSGPPFILDNSLRGWHSPGPSGCKARIALITEYANEKYCDTEAELAAAGGVDENGGIKNPKKVKLPPEQFYYRFASSNDEEERRRIGRWWVEFKTFATIRRYANESTTGGAPDSKRMAIRYYLALPYSFSECDRLLRACLKVPVYAFRGAGKRARTSKGQEGETQIITPPPNVELYQLYIPGLNIIPPDTIWKDFSDEYLWASPHFKQS